MASLDGMWVSGEVCEVVGKYGSACCCGSIEADFVMADVFPYCPTCGKKMKWRRAFANTLPINTFETPVGEKKSRRPKP